MYNGPYPTLTSGGVTAMQTSTSDSSGTTTIANAPASVATPSILASASTVLSQTGASSIRKTGSGGATSTAPVVVATQTSVTVSKSGAQTEETYSSIRSVIFLGVGMMMIGLWL